MALVQQGHPMAKKSESGGYVSIKVEAAAVLLAKKAAALKGETMRDYISEVLKREAERDIRTEAASILREKKVQPGRD